MDEFDDLLPTPDDQGKLNLSHRAWQDVDEIVWTMGMEVIALNLSYNRMIRISSEIANLRLLRELDCSCNRLEILPKKISALKQLTKLKCNGNELIELPQELGSCLLLEEIIVSENKIVSLPRSLGKLKSLKRLCLQNNDLTMLPPTLADIGDSLIHINCRNNPQLKMIPPKIQSADKTALIRWILKLHRKNENECQSVLDLTNEMNILLKATEQRHLQLTSQLQQLEDERLELLRFHSFSLGGALFSSLFASSSSVAPSLS